MGRYHAVLKEEGEELMSQLLQYRIEAKGRTGLFAKDIAWVVGLETVARIYGRSYRGPRFRFPILATYLLPLVIVVFWILRNIPGWPFEILAPR